jgi:hypothetical protein
MKLFRFVAIYRKCIVVAMLMSFLHNRITAQQTGSSDDKEWRIHAGILVAMTYAIDRNFSSAEYNGFGGGFFAGAEYLNNRTIHRLAVQYSKGNPETQTQPVYNASQVRYAADYSFLYRLTKQPGTLFEIAGGGALNILYNKRNFHGFINKNATYEFAGSVGPALFFRLAIGKGFSVSDQISVPLLSLIKQPPSVSEGTVSGSTDLKGPDGFLRLLNGLAIEKSVGSNSLVSLSYVWDYYQLKNLQTVKQANHQLKAAFILIL